MIQIGELAGRFTDEFLEKHNHIPSWILGFT